MVRDRLPWLAEQIVAAPTKTALNNRFFDIFRSFWLCIHRGPTPARVIDRSKLHVLCQTICPQKKCVTLGCWDDRHPAQFAHLLGAAACMCPVKRGIDFCTDWYTPQPSGTAIHAQTLTRMRTFIRFRFWGLRDGGIWDQPDARADWR